MWLIVNTIDKQSDEWLAENIPGGNGRTSSSIARHLRELRKNSKLPSEWRLDRLYGPAWTMAEDLEVIEWIHHGNKRIDGRVFVKADRSGDQIKRRGRYIMENIMLDRAVLETKEIIREAQREYDEAPIGLEKETAYAGVVHAKKDGECKAWQMMVDGPVYETLDW